MGVFMNSRILSTLFLCAFFGCTLEPKYETPDVSITTQWKNQQETEILTPRYENWWDVFEDCVLADLIKRAIENNQDLIAASERVEQARDIANISRSKLFPWLTLPLGYSNQEVLTQLYGPGLPSSQFVTREHQLEYSLPLTMSYEVDLWGKIRSSYKSADLGAKARQDAYDAALLVITTELANAYFQTRILDAVTSTYESILQTRRKTQEIYSSRYEGKLADYGQVAFSDQELDQTESLYSEVKQQRAVFENMIAVLLGSTPSEFHLNPMPLIELPPQIPEGVPASALARRPDIAEQQLLMQSIHALLGVAYAEYFPALDLEGGLGVISPLSQYFFKGLSFFWSIGANLTELIFDGMARYYKVQLTWSQFRESVARYRQTVLNAFQEVENSLSNLQWLQKRMDSISHAVESAKINQKISNDQYTYGVISYLQVAEKEREVLDNDLIYLTLLSFRYMNTVQLIRALGGGW